MATNNSNQNNVNVGLNLNGNAVASVQQLVTHMTQLKLVTVDVGAALKAIDKEMQIQGNGKRPTLQSMKAMQQNVNMLSTTPDTVLAQFYRNQSRNIQDQARNALVKTTKHLTNPSTLNKLFDEHGTKLVGEAIKIRLDSAKGASDTKAIQKAQLELQTFKAEMAKYNTSLKGLNQLKVEQDQLVSQMMSTPVGAAALRGTMRRKLQTQYYSGAQEKAVENYMLDPSRLKARSSSSIAKATPEALRNYSVENASKIEATKRLMGEMYLDSSKYSKEQLNNYGKILTALDQEKVTLQAINTLRRKGVLDQDDSLKKLREEQNVKKANQQMDKLLTRVNNHGNLTADQLAGMSPADLIAHQITATRRLSDVKAVALKAEQIGDASKLKAAEKIQAEYVKELRLISEITKLKNKDLDQRNPQLIKLREAQQAKKNNSQIDDFLSTNSSFRATTDKNLSAMSLADAKARQISMTERLTQAEKVLGLATKANHIQGMVESKLAIGRYTEELDKVRALSGLKRKSLIDQNSAIQALKEETNIKKINLQIDNLLNGNLRVKTANSSQIVNMSDQQLSERQNSMATRLAQARALKTKAESVGNTTASAEANKLISLYESEMVKLRDVANYRKQIAKAQDVNIQKLKAETDAQKASVEINRLLNGSLKTKALDQAGINGLSQEKLNLRQLDTQNRLNQAKAAYLKADEIGDAKANKAAAAQYLAYKKELEMLKARNKELNPSTSNTNGQPKSGNNMVNRFNEINTGESSGALLGIQGLLMRNYMLWGAFTGAITGSYAFLRDFEVAFKQTQAISQATDTQMQSLKNSILEVAENSRFTAIEITEAATALAQAGFSMSEIQTTLESVTLLATATGSTLKETVDIATASLGAFQLSAENMPKIVNQITQAMNLSKLDIQKFQLAVQYAGNAASDAGLNFEELLATVATVANAGVRSGSTLGTGFRQLLSDLVSPSTKFDAILTRLGLTAADVDVRTNGLVGSLKRLKEAGFTTADAYESFEVRSVAFYTALSNNIAAYDDLTANLDNNTAAQAANEIQMNSLGAQTDRMFNQFKALAEVAGAGVRETLTDVFHLMGDLFTGMKNLTDNGVVRFVVKAAVMTTTLVSIVYLVKGAGAALLGLRSAMVAAAAANAALATSVAATGNAFKFAFPQIAILSAIIAVAILGIKAFTKSNDDLKNSVEASQTALNKLKDSTGNLQTSIVEVDKKITSLESRFESLQEDPAAVAVEFVNLQTKASELGVVLEVDLGGGINSVRKGWELLRNELSKSLVIDLSQQIEEIDLLAQKMLALKVQEAGGKPNMFSEKGAKDNGYGKVVDYNSLTVMGDVPLAAGTDKNAYARRNNAMNSGKTYNNNLFKAIADANKAGGGKGRDIDVEALLKDIADNPRRLSLMTPEEQEAAIPKMRQDYLRVNAVINNAKKQFINASRNTQDPEQKKAAETMVNTLVNFQNQLGERAGTVNQLFSFKNQQKTLTSQRDTENEVVNIRSALISGDVSDLTSKSNFGNAYSLGKQGKAKEKYNTRELAALMPAIKEMSKKYGVPEDVIIGHMITESGVNQGVTSEAGAMGLMQVMPETAKGMGLDAGRVKSDKLYNLEAGVKYLAQMKKQTGGSFEDMSRAYFMGAGGLNKYKSSNGKSYAKGYNQSTDYVKTVYANVLDFQKTRGGRYSVMDELDIPENTRQTLSEIDTLNSIIDGAKAQIASKGDDISQLSESDKKLIAKWSAQIQAAEKIVSEKSANTNNVIRAAQARDKAERTREKGFKNIDLQNLANNVYAFEQEILEAERKLGKGDFTKEGVEKLKNLYAKLSEAQQKQASLESDIKVLDSATYDGTKLVSDKNFQELADMQLDASIKKADDALDKKRRAALETAAKAFSQKIKDQNAEFLTSFKNDIGDLKENYELAMSILDFNTQVFDRQISESSGLTQMKRERALMDDPLYRENYTDTQRSDMDRKMEKIASANTRDSVIFKESEIKATQEYIAALQLKINNIETKQLEESVNRDLIINRSGLDEADRKMLISESEKKDLEFKKELNNYKQSISKMEDDISTLNDDIKNLDSANRPEGYSVGQMFRSQAAENYRLTQTQAYADGNVTAVIDSINDSFNNLINTAIDASDNVDDFFKIITGGSSESREAFKAFGYSIIQTMAKIVQDAMVKKFMSMMMGMLFPEKSGAAGQAGGGSSTMGVVGSIIGAVAGAFGQGVISGTGTAWGSAQSVNVGGQTMPLTYAAQGGMVKGVATNVDSEPYMLADKEYIMPSHVTETLGQGFMDRMRKDPNSVINDKIKMNPNASGGAAQKPSFTNVFVVSPDKMPSSVSKSDIIVAIEDNVARSGSLKKLIKQVANG